MDTFKTAPMTRLLNEIQENTTKYLEFFSAQRLPEPSFENGEGLSSGQGIPIDIQTARSAAIEAADELRLLLLGPLGLVMSFQADQYLMLALQYIYRHKLVQHVFLNRETTFREIAAAARLPPKDVTRFLRLAASRHVFHEASKGAIVHTAASRQLLDNPGLEAWVTIIADEYWPALARTVDATERWPGSEEPNESGYSLGHTTKESIFDVIKCSPARQQRFMDVQGFSHQVFGFGMEHLLWGYDFSNVRVLVDMGGAHGEVAIALAHKYPTMEIVVQDKPEVIEGLKKCIPAELKHRIKGMEHDFFTIQPVRSADVYFFRWVFHNWSDKYCVKILQSLVPSLKKGLRIVINDLCVPEL
ncbi:putative hydroxyindole O-methyltransferase [Daldinia eschscholtzii]|nr:putative hydroxyindole O-methyltransferase [Daldinia eschscholtzii]